ncbi:MAG: hypothetical protein AAF938_26265 [Myxococcota bacterium]
MGLTVAIGGLAYAAVGGMLAVLAAFFIGLFLIPIVGMFAGADFGGVNIYVGTKGAQISQLAGDAQAPTHEILRYDSPDHTWAFGSSQTIAGHRGGKAIGEPYQVFTALHASGKQLAYFHGYGGAVVEACKRIVAHRNANQDLVRAVVTRVQSQGHTFPWVGGPGIGFLQVGPRSVIVRDDSGQLEIPGPHLRTTLHNRELVLTDASSGSERTIDVGGLGDARLALACLEDVKRGV